MYIKLLPEQLVKFWDMIRFAIVETFMPRGKCTNEILRYMLANLLAGKSQCWAAFKQNEDRREFVGFLITRIMVDQGLGDRILYIDSVYAFQSPTEELIFGAWTVLSEFAKKNNCKTVQGLTDNPRVGQLADRLGFTTRQLLIKEVE